MESPWEKDFQTPFCKICKGTLQHSGALSGIQTEMKQPSVLPHRAARSPMLRGQEGSARGGRQHLTSPAVPEEGRGRFLPASRAHSLAVRLETGDEETTL